MSVDQEDPETPKRKVAIAAKLRALLLADEVDRLLTLLDAHAWDVSFFVDAW